MFITILILVTVTSIRQPQTISYKCLLELLTTIPFLYNILVKHFYYIVSYYDCQYNLSVLFNFSFHPPYYLCPILFQPLDLLFIVRKYLLYLCPKCP